MKKLIFILLIWCAIAAVAVVKTVQKQKISPEANKLIQSISGAGCSSEPPRDELFMSSTEPSIRRLGEYEKKCSSAVTNTLMYFTIMPKDNNVAKELAKQTSETIILMNKNGLKPLVIIEPDTAWGLIDFKEFNDGFYDRWIETYFKELKSYGIKDEMMGTWIPFPEANLPYWNHQNTKPSDFSKAVNKYLGILREVFPKARTGIMLNSATYPTDDYNWADGEYLSLVPYLENIDKGLVDTFGLQGLPWMSSADTVSREIFEPAEFLNIEIAEEAAKTIGVKDIWFNTGTFASKYASEPDKKVIVPAHIRKEILEKISIQADKLQKKGFTVSVNIFAEDKTNTAEATDWSYFGSNDTQNSAHEVAILNFIKDLYSKKIGLSLYIK